MVNPYVPSRTVEWDVAEFRFDYGFFGYHDPRIDTEYNRFLFRDLTGALLCSALAIGDVIFPWLIMRFQLNWLILSLTEGALALSMATGDVILHVVGSRTSLRVTRMRHLLTLLLTFICIFNNSLPVVSQVPRCASFTDLVYLLGGPTFDAAPMSVAKRCRDVTHTFVVCVYMIVFVFIRLRFHEVVFFCPIAIGAYYLGYVDYPPPVFDQSPLVKGVVFFLTHVVGCTLAISIAWVTDHMRRGSFEQSILLTQATMAAQRRQREVESLLGTMVAESVLEKLAGGQSTFSAVESATVLFSDIVMFTQWSSTRSPQQVVAMLNVLVPAFDTLAETGAIEKVKTIGDAYWAVSGLPDAVHDHPTRMLRFAFGMLVIVKRQNGLHREWADISIRVGVHSGPLCGAVLGSHAISYEVFGATSALAEEVEKAGIGGHVCCSSDTADLISPQDGFLFAPHSRMALPSLSTVDGSLADPSAAAATGGRQQHLVILHVTRATLDVAAEDARASSSLGLPGTPRSQNSSSVRSKCESSHSVQQRFLENRQQQRLTNKPLLRDQVARVGGGDATPDPTSDSACPKPASKWVVGEDEAAIEARFVERRFSWILPTFASAQLEDDFLFWARQRHIRTRRVVRGLAVGAFAAMMTALAMERPAAMPGASIALFVIGGAVLLLSLNLAVWDTGHHLDECLSVAGGVCTIVAAGLIPYSVVGNDVLYAAIWFSILFSCGSATLPAVVRAGFVELIFSVPAVVFAVGSPVFSFVVALCVFLAAGATLFAFFNDRSIRQQFKEETKAEYYRAQVVTAAAQQRLLLETLVPTHVIPELLEWLQHSLNPEHSIVRVVPEVCVAFVTLKQRHHVHSAACEESASSSWLMAAHTQVDQHLSDRKAFTLIEKVKTVGDIVLLAGPLNSAPMMRDEADDKHPPLAAVACRELCCAVARIRESNDLLVGFHVGEVVGAVVGRTRLTFDIFGDCVNVASRMMTMAKMEGDGASSSSSSSDGGRSTGFASAPFVRCYTEAACDVMQPEAALTCIGDALSPRLRHPSFAVPATADGLLVFGAPEERVAKGKGLLRVHRVVRWGTSSESAPSMTVAIRYEDA